MLLANVWPRSSCLEAGKYDVVIFGATGFTGRLVAAHFAVAGGPVTWALAGRSRSKLEAVRDTLSVDYAPLIIADALDADSIDAMVRRARVVLSTVGPYWSYGSLLVAACAQLGVDYIDLTGESHWIWKMIREHDAAAQRSGARLVHSCGFDSIPADVGVQLLVETAQQRYGRRLHKLHGRILVAQGAISGGTIASIAASQRAIAADTQVAAVLSDRHSLEHPVLDPGAASSASDLVGVFEDPVTAEAATHSTFENTDVHLVYRSAALLGRQPMTFDEFQLTNASDALLAAHGVLAFRNARREELVATARAEPTAFAPRKLPQPGGGPTGPQRQSGYFAYLVQSDELGAELSVTVTCDTDPGYLCTSKMVAESAICLVTPGCALKAPAGSGTPASTLGLALIQRLEANAGMRWLLR